MPNEFQEPSETTIDFVRISLEYGGERWDLNPRPLEPQSIDPANKHNVSIRTPTKSTISMSRIMGEVGVFFINLEPVLGHHTDRG